MSRGSGNLGDSLLRYKRASEDPPQVRKQVTNMVGAVGLTQLLACSSEVKAEHCARYMWYKGADIVLDLLYTVHVTVLSTLLKVAVDLGGA